MPYTLPPGAKNVFHGVRNDVWQWDQEQFDGTVQTFECTTRKDSASVIAFLDPQTILLTEQLQPGREKLFTDIPGGVVEPGESPEVAVRRELLEETGYEIGKLRLFREIGLSGASRFSTYLYIATDLKNKRPQMLDGGERITLRPTPYDEAVKLSFANGLRQAWAMLAILAMRYDETERKNLEEFLATSLSTNRA